MSDEKPPFCTIHGAVKPTPRDGLLAALAGLSQRDKEKNTR